jgi:hypothetical protein
MWSHRGNVERFARVTEILDPATRQLPIEQRDVNIGRIPSSRLSDSRFQARFSDKQQSDEYY